MIRAIRKLERIGWLTVARNSRPASNKHSSNTYRFIIPAEESLQSETEGGVTTETPLCHLGNTGGVTTGTPPCHTGNGTYVYNHPSNHLKNNLGERRKRRSPGEVDPRVRPVLSAFRECYQRRHGKPPTRDHLDEGRDGKRIRGKIPADYTADELVALIDRFFDAGTPAYITRSFTIQDFIRALPRLREQEQGGMTHGRSRHREPSRDVSDWLE